jgi:excisionase family DNA binding protein
MSAEVEKRGQPGACPPEPSAVFRLAFSIRETAQMLGVCEKSVRRLIERGLLKTSRALRHHRVTKQEIERFLKDTM